MSENIFLRMTVDVCVFAEENPSAKQLAKTLIKEGKGQTGVGERLAREFMDQIQRGHIEIDDVRAVEDHS